MFEFGGGDKFSGAELPGHSIYIYLIYIHHDRLFSDCASLLPQEASCALASLTTLSLIQLSDFCQLNIVHLTCI